MSLFNSSDPAIAAAHAKVLDTLANIETEYGAVFVVDEYQQELRNAVAASTIDETCPDCKGRGVVPYVYPVVQDGGMFPAYGETPCRRCGGDGVPPPEPEPDVCDACNGRGWEMDRARSESGAWIDVHIDCTACGGFGIGLPDPGDGGSRGPDGYYPDDFEATPAGHNWR